MWPKVIAQLFELLPHISRLLPLADKFFTSKAASEKATEAAMVAMAEGVRGDLGQVTAAHMGLYRQLQDQSAQITTVGEEVKINDGPFANLNGRIDEIDPDRGKLKISVSIFGRFTPVELEYWQVQRSTE